MLVSSVQKNNLVTHVHPSWGFPCGSDSKVSAYNAGDLGSIPGLGRSPAEGNGSPLQDSCLGNPTNRGVWQATVHGVPKEPDTTERVNNNNGACEFHECFRQIIKAESGLGHFSNFAPPPRTEQRGCIRECPHVLEETTEPGFATSQLTGQVGPLGQGFSQCGPGHIRTVFRMQILSVPRPRPADPESRG